MPDANNINKRVVVIHWKNQRAISFEVFSNLKNLCLSYPQYNYNTLNNYLSKEKIAYENDTVRIERKNIILKPKQNIEAQGMRIVPVVRKGQIKEMQESGDDLNYWLQQPISQRAAAVTFIISQSLKNGERMNKTIVNKQKMKA